MGYRKDSSFPDPVPVDQSGRGAFSGAQPFPAEDLVTVRWPIWLHFKRHRFHRFQRGFDKRKLDRQVGPFEQSFFRVIDELFKADPQGRVLKVETRSQVGLERILDFLGLVKG